MRKQQEQAKLQQQQNKVNQEQEQPKSSERGDDARQDLMSAIMIVQLKKTIKKLRDEYDQQV